MPHLSVKLSILTVGLACSLWTVQARAGDDSRGAGLIKCAEVVKVIEDPTKQDQNPRTLQLLNWVLGYMTAVNAQLLSTGNVIDLSEYSDISILKSVYNFCKAYPDRIPMDVVEGALRVAPRTSEPKLKGKPLPWEKR